jgi:hypothetical protein
MGIWKCFAEINGDSCMTMIAADFDENELIKRERQKTSYNNNTNKQQAQLN